MLSWCWKWSSIRVAGPEPGVILDYLSYNAEWVMVAVEVEVEVEVRCRMRVREINISWHHHTNAHILTKKLRLKGWGVGCESGKIFWYQNTETKMPIPSYQTLTPDNNFILNISARSGYVGVWADPGPETETLILIDSCSKHVCTAGDMLVFGVQEDSLNFKALMPNTTGSRYHQYGIYLVYKFEI